MKGLDIDLKEIAFLNMFGKKMIKGMTPAVHAIMRVEDKKELSYWIRNVLEETLYDIAMMPDMYINTTAEKMEIYTSYLTEYVYFNMHPN